MIKLLYETIYKYYCKDNWAKMTKRYYGIKWKMVTKAVSDLKTFPLQICEEFIAPTLGHFK